MTRRKSFPFNSNRSATILFHGQDGKQAGTSDSLSVGRSLVQVTRWATKFYIFFDSPGHQTDAWALDRHLMIPK